MKFPIVFFQLLNVVYSAKILGYFNFPSISHQFVFQAVVRELSLRGHEVTYVSPNNIKDPKLINLTEVDLSDTYKVFETTDAGIFNRNAINLIAVCVFGNKLIEDIITIEMELEQVKEILMKPENSYDLIIVEAMNPFHYGLQHKFKAPLIAISSFGLTSVLHDIIGNQNHPILYPDAFCGYLNPIKNIWEKIDSFYVNMVFYLYSKFVGMPKYDKMARTYFGEDMPYVEDLVRNVSIMFGNVDPIFSDRRAIAPNYKEVWNIHLKAPQPLPADLQRILDDAKTGLVYFSLGTNVRFEHVEENIKQEILKALGDLPYTVLCKWESEDYPGKPNNVVLRKWIPQQSILAHPNVKVFVTQGGLQSSEEAIINGVPLVVIPFLGDQPLNAKILTSRGMAETILPQSIKNDLLRDTILKVAKNEKYRLKAHELRDIFLDQPRTGLEEIVWWCEYVIRHKGATHLRSPSAGVSLYEYFMLDVLGVIFIVLFATYVAMKIIFGAIIRLLRGQKHEKQKND
ncbi:hypothetical protein HHI36_002718 [Cryptolaemus montrouzieri]|uniref:UDP-glucuronosyltransferase n=1 Tax=Cryptolaemus montrouzieri TaxID=559131 RepID=A0ABD2PBK9_9CUCU